MRTRSDKVTDALDLLIEYGVKLDEIFERYNASTVEQAAKDYIEKERAVLKENIFKMLNKDGGYVWKEDSSKVMFDDFFIEFYLPLLHSASFGNFISFLSRDKLTLRQLEYAHLRLVEQPEFRPAQQSLLEAA